VSVIEQLIITVMITTLGKPFN